MKLRQFNVTNYRSCLLTTFSPNNGLTTLIGVNGSGKSNLLSAILLMKKAAIRTGRYPLLDEEYLNRTIIKSEIDLDGNLIRLRGEVFYFTNDRNIDEVVSTKIKWNLESITGEKSWIELPFEIALLKRNSRYNFVHGGRILSYKGGWGYPLTTKTPLSESLLKVLLEVSEYLQNINYYSASQFSDPSRCPVSLIIDEDRPQGRGLKDTIDHEHFIFDLYRSWKSGSEAFQRYKHVTGKDSIGLIDNIHFDEIRLPSNVIEVRAGGKTIKKERTQLVVVPIFTIDGSPLSPNQLSEGTFKTLALLFYVLTDDSRLLLVEEPEVCIHHGLLSSVIAIIKQESKDKQIIISTHSDYVLDQLEPENVVLVDKKEGKGTKARSVSQAMSKTDFKALRSYLEESGSLGEYWREGGLVDE